MIVGIISLLVCQRVDIFWYNLFMDKVSLSVVIPSYNEMNNLQKGVLDKVLHFLTKKFPQKDYEVLIVDDGSTDGSREFVEEFIADNPHFQLIKNPHLGKAGAVTTGVLKAQGEIILFTDMDQATPIEELNKLLPFFEEGFDIVIGSRSTQRKGAPLSRVLMARGMILLRSSIVGLKGISDTQCGFKAFRRDVAQKLFSTLKLYSQKRKEVKGSMVTAGFDVEFLFLAQKLGYKIKEVPVSWLYVESRRVSPVKDSIDGLVSLFKIKLNDLKGLYD